MQRLKIKFLDFYLQIVLYERNKIVKNLLLEILNEIVVKEEEFGTENKIGGIELRKLVARCRYITILQKEGVRLYTINSTVLSDLIDLCKGCRFFSISKIEKGTLRKCEIKEKYKKVECSHTIMLSLVNASKVLKRNGYIEDSGVSFFDKHEVKIEDKEVKVWQVKDFTIYVCKLYGEYFPTFISPDRSIIRRELIKILRAMREKIGSVRLANSVLKTHLRLTFIKCAHKKKNVNLKYLIGRELNELIQNFPQYCVDKGIYCSYMKNECVLKGKCSQFLMDKMRNKWN